MYRLTRQPATPAWLLTSAALGVAVVALLVFVDPAVAGGLREMGKNTNREVGALVGSLFLVGLMIAVAVLWWQRMYPLMGVSLLGACIVAYLIFDSSSAAETLKGIGSDIMPGGK